MNEARCILHVSDLTEGSSAAAHIAQGLACHYQASLLLLHVMEPQACSVVPIKPHAFMDSVLEAMSQPQSNFSYNDANRKLQRLSNQAIDAGIPASMLQSYLLEGAKVQTVLKVADKMAVDLIVMPVDNKQGIFGSVAAEVQQRSTKRVLLVS